MGAALPSGLIRPIILVELTFRSATEYVCTAPFAVTFGGNTYKGIGSLGSMGEIKEGTQVQADSTSVTLSGIDTTLLGESLDDIQQGAPAVIWFGLLKDDNTFLGSPAKAFAGVVDLSTVNYGTDTSTITLTLENLMVDGQRPSMLRYTSADQRIKYPDDIGFGWVEQLNDLALSWGQ